MPTPVLLGALFIGASLPLLWWSVASASPRGGGKLLGRFSRRGEASTDMRELALAEAASKRVVSPFFRSITRRVRRITPSGFMESLEQKVTLAGLEATWPVERLLAAKVIVGATSVIFAFLFIRRGLTLPRGIVACLIAWIGIFGPGIMLDRRGRERQDSIERALPDALDQITMGVEAGLGFEAALSRVAHTGQSALNAEFNRVLKEMQIGVPRSEALRSLAGRTTVQDLHTFVLAVVQAEEYGLPIAQVLRVQAGELRTKRRQRAEERALRIPVKLIFPLGLCIFPALFIVILGPGAMRIWRALNL